MRNLPEIVSVLTLAALSGLALAAQSPQAAAAAGQTANAQQAAAPATSTANSPEPANLQLRPVNCVLVTKIDTKNAKAGEPVAVKTTEAATTASGVVLPKGSKILGHIVDVQAFNKENANAKVTLQFDQAELKDGKTLPIKSVLASVAPSAGMIAAGQSDPFGVGSPGATGASPAGGASMGASRGMAPSLPTQTQGSTVAMMNDDTAHNAPQAGAVVSKQGNVVLKTTAMPGVLIATTANGQPFSNAAGALLGVRQNVHLAGGTQMVLEIADASVGSPR